MQPPNDLSDACDLSFHSFMQRSCSPPLLLLVSVRLGRCLQFPADSPEKGPPSACINLIPSPDKKNSLMKADDL